MSLFLCLTIIITTLGIHTTIAAELDDSTWQCINQHESYMDRITEVFIDGENYKLLYDVDGMVVGLCDNDGEMIAKYSYDKYHLLSCVFEYSDGRWIENNSQEFVGNKNNILYMGFEYDRKTKTYLVFGRNYDPVSNRFTDGSIDDEYLYTEENPFLPYAARNGEKSINSAVDSDAAAQLWAEALMSSSSHGVPIAYSSTWYNSISLVELLSRAIYCEGGTAYTNEDTAVARVLLNRYNNSGFPNNFGDILKAPSQFASVTGGSSPTNNSRNPVTSTSRWSWSTYLACLLLTTTSSSEWNTLVGNPIGNQLFFYSYTTAKIAYNNGNSVFTGTTSSTLKYMGSSISSVYVLGYGNVTSFPTLFTNYSPTQYSRNIYYNLN